MWKVYFFKTKTGEIGPAVEPATVSWRITINDTEELDMKIYKSEIKFGDMNKYLEPWWGSILLLWDDTPVFAGPIITRSSESPNHVTLQAKGIRELLSRRSPLFDMQDWTRLKQIDYLNGWTSIKSSEGAADVKADGFKVINRDTVKSYRYYNKAYGTLAKMVVQDSLTKRGGELPIRFDNASSENDTSDDKVFNASKEDRTAERPHLLFFKGVDNPDVDATLSDLTSRTNGPDILFIPKMTSDYHVFWDMYTGMSDSKRDIQTKRTSELIWDITAQRSDISEFSVKYSGVNMLNRLFSQTNGDNGAVFFWQNTGKLNEDYPLLETYTRYQNITDQTALTTKAKSKFDNDSIPRKEITASVRTTDTMNPPGSFWPGEYATIYVGNQWLGINPSEGKIRVKILSISGDLSNNIDITFKETYSDE